MQNITQDINIEAQVERLSQTLISKKLDQAVVFILEAHRPFWGIAKNLTFFLAPYANFLNLSKKFQFLEVFFSDTTNLDLLTKHIRKLKKI